MISFKGAYYRKDIINHTFFLDSVYRFLLWPWRIFEGKGR